MAPPLAMLPLPLPPLLLFDPVESVDDVPDIWLLSLDVCVGLLVQANNAKDR
jgi:hypothetical protein